MKSRRLRSQIVYTAIAITVAAVSFLSVPFANAQIGGATVTVGDVPRTSSAIKETILDAIVKAGRISFLNVLRSAVNQFAYDTATYVGSGGEGQKPVYFTKKFGEWIRDQASNAGGAFVEEFVKTQQDDPDALLSKFDICAPDLSASLRISLGLTDFINESQGIPQSRCNLKQIYESASSQIENMQRPEYLRDLGLTAFSPETTDIGIAYTLFGGVIDEQNRIKEGKLLERQESEGFIDPETAISANKAAPPGTNKSRIEQAKQLQTESFFTQTGDIFVDAANIFLNQLALSAFNKLISSLSSNENGGGGSVNNYYTQGGVGGVTEVSQRASTLLQAQFNERSDYNILGELTSCQNEAKPGPTNCVISQQLAQAISNKQTVGEAISQGLLDPNKRLGFDEQGNEFSYRDGYPYRSLIILRKYRILPVGWEVAAQYIRNHAQETRDVTLADLIACFSNSDEDVYPGYYQSWCSGLVDPSWVLKVPKMFCGMEGYGSEILSAITTPSQKGYCTKTDAVCTSESRSNDCASNFVACTNDTGCSAFGSDFPKCNFTVGKDVEVTRNQNYCADEQSCIKENANGSCAYYGYCTQEKRRWVFNQQQDNSCKALNNTCQTFQSEGSAPVSYLQNTLDYANCGPNQVGCRLYATNGAYNTTTHAVTWSATANTRNFNKNIEECDANGEGCHEFVRTKDDLDTNLVADGSFEGSTCVSENNNETYAPSEPTTSFNPFVKSALAQTSLGQCQLQTLAASGTLTAPNNRWHIRVNSGSVNAGIVNDQADHGSQSLYIEGNGGIYSRDNGAPSILPAGFVMEGGRFYSLSARVYVTAGSVRAGFGTQAGQFSQSTATNSWQTLLVTFYNPSTTPVHEFFVEATDATAKFYVDSIKLSVGRAATTYNDYLSSNVIYEKLLPSYLESVCYVSTGSSGGGGVGEIELDGPNPGADYRLKANAPAECFNFARKCNADEVGCEAYTAVASGVQVTGKIKPKDICPGTCVGYDVFVRQADSFNAQAPAYFIPQTAENCSAQAVGCTAFTNLDKLAGGAEAVEYYTAMRSCIKPDAAACGEFYSWEGSDESGYQLKVFSLKQNGSQPASTLTQQQEEALCNADIYKKTPDQPGYNFDCREFYGRDGAVSYHLYTKTISCSDDCHPYRREVATETECTAGGGIWETAQSRCIYNAIPGEGTTCQAAEVGCGEYTGNIASNVRIVLNDAFEDSTNPTDSWAGATQSNTALNLGGHSLSGTNPVKIVGEAVVRNKSYTISFLAKSASGNMSITGIDFMNGDNQTSAFATAGYAVGSEWKLYTFNLANLDHDVTPIAGSTDAPDSGERLRLNFSGPVYLDNIRLTEVPNRYYVIKDSWNTPEECDQDLAGGDAPRYMLGCSQYTKTDNSIINLHSFSQLCQDSAAGCEAMIDTYNSSDYKKKLTNDTNNNGACETGETGCFETPADDMLNVVFDPSKQCGSEQKGCQRLGLGATYDGTTSFTDIYLKNDPDRYNTIACSASAVGCSQWTDTNGSTVYFKDPGNQACEWRLEQGTQNSYKWFRKKINRCGGTANGAICSSNTDCSGGQTCQLFGGDVACPIDSSKTIGSGGSNTSRVVQPSTWAGVCEGAQAGCTEYIDPLSKINENLVLNPDYRNLDTDNTIEYWIDGPGGSEANQTLSLFPQTVYILKGDSRANPDVSVKIDCPGGNAAAGEGLRVLGSNNEFALDSDNISDTTLGLDKSIQFYIQRNSSNDRIDCSIIRSSRAVGLATVSLRQAVVEYQLAQNLDRTSHNGLVNNNKGAVLFNERAQSGNAKIPLLYNADATYETSPTKGAPPSSTTSPRNANVLLQVTPDRVCSQWLSCTTYLPDPSNPSKQVCLDLGLCDSLDANGNCNNFVEAPKKNQNLMNTNISNLTGYSKVGYQQEDRIGRPETTLSDYYNFAAMTQIGEVVDVADNSFEAGNGWQMQNPVEPVTILNQPGLISAAQIEPLQTVKSQSTSDFLAPDGQAVLKVAANKLVRQSGKVSVTSGKRYVLTFYAYSKGEGLKVKMESQTGTGGSFDLSLKRCSKLQTYCSVDSDCPTGESCQFDASSQNRWVKQSIGLKASATSYKIAFENTGGSEVFIDDVRLEAGLNTRCSGPDKDQADCDDPTTSDTALKPQFTGSSCRLYAKENSLSCLYTDNDNVTHKGIRGYCLENDPKDPGTCLLWYPVGRIASDTGEEGTNVDFGSNNVFYCVDAQDECVGNIPRFYCRQFIQVDKSVYWNQHMAQGSAYKMPDTTGTPPFPDDPIFYTPAANRKIDFGGIGGPLVPIPAITRNYGGYSYFGSLTKSAISSKEPVTLNGSDISSFLPYYGLSSQLRCPSMTVPFFNAGQNNTTSEQFSGHELGEGVSQDYPLGNWDFCAAVQATDVDFKNCGANCEYGNIQSGNVFQSATCGVNDTVCANGFSARCETSNSNGNWSMRVSDNNGDGDDPACVAYCYNRTEEYSVAKDSGKALDAVRRLFVGNANWSLYTWNTGVTPNRYTAQSFSQPYPLTACNGTGAGVRPNKNTSNNNDYCFIYPTVSNVKVRGLNNQDIVVNGSEDIPLSFETHTDVQQLPLRQIVIDWGYRDTANNPEQLTLIGNYADVNPRQFNHRYDYFAIKAGANNSACNYLNYDPVCQGAQACCILKPKVTITDNWGYSSTVTAFTKSIIVKKP